MNTSDLIERFSKLDTSDFPDFHNYSRPLEMGLWVLWVAKGRLGIKKLTAEQIASIIRDVKEISTDAKSITNSFNRAGDKVDTSVESGGVYFQIMKPGKELLVSQVKEGSIEVIPFQPGKRFTSKRFLLKNVLNSFKGDLKIIDPYCGERTLDVLNDVKDKRIEFLTKVETLREKKSRFLRTLKDFKSENPNVEFRDYPHTDIHDRYIISTESLAILGYSIKDLGAKESLMVILNKDTAKDVIEDLIRSFDRRWAQSSTL